jgi:hypothetical protein
MARSQRCADIVENGITSRSSRRMTCDAKCCKNGKNRQAAHLHVAGGHRGMTAEIALTHRSRVALAPRQDHAESVRPTARGLPRIIHRRSSSF